MDKKAQIVIVYGFMIGLVIIILALAFIHPVNLFVQDARNTTSYIGGMDCNNASISDFTKNACLSTDLSMPIFIGVLIFMGGAVITYRYLIQ